MKKLYLFFLILIMSLLGCVGIKFSESAKQEGSTLELPGDFLNRRFLVGLSAYRNKPHFLPGRLYKITQRDAARIYNADRIPIVFTKKGIDPELEILTDQRLFDLKVSSKFNGSLGSQVLNVAVKRNESYQFGISDAFLSIIPDTLIDSTALLDYYRNNINPEQLHSYVFITGVKVSKYVRNRFVEVSSSATINAGSVLAIDGKVYNSRDDFYTDYFVSVDWLPLSNLVPKWTLPRHTLKLDTISIDQWALVPRGYRLPTTLAMDTIPTDYWVTGIHAKIPSIYIDKDQIPQGVTLRAIRGEFLPIDSISVIPADLGDKALLVPVSSLPESYIKVKTDTEELKKREFKFFKIK